MDFGQALGLYNYWIVIFLMMTGFYMVIARGNLIKTIIGLNIFQTSVVLLYVTMGKVAGGKGAPILPESELHHHGDGHGHGDHASNVLQNSFQPEIQLVGFEESVTETATASHAHVDAQEHAHEAVSHAAETLYTNPLPSVLMLTAIVVGVATTALALALTVRIREDYGTIEEDEILELDLNS
jgi:multicomponent Na+:H+ antiporter subunit C